MLIDVLDNDGYGGVFQIFWLFLLGLKVAQKNDKQGVEKCLQHDLAVRELGFELRIHGVGIVLHCPVISGMEHNHGVIALPIQSIFKKVGQDRIGAEQGRTNLIQQLPLHEKFNDDAVIGVVENAVWGAVLQQTKVPLLQLVLLPLADVDTGPGIDVEHFKILVGV